ncbi:MAG: M56 family metallopeptidase, partial [Planctomycetes bacterium]|nr:M56 family metallopeptidase [Planctomycetota bacterium]
QAWQLTALILAVLLATRWGTQRRPQLAYVLWLLVLVKCLTPPLWSAPSSVFCWAQTALAAPPAAAATRQTDPDARPVTVALDRVPIRQSNEMADTAIIADARPVLTAPNHSVRPGVNAAATRPLTWLRPALLTLWLVGTGGLVVVASWRCWRFLQGLRRTAIPHGADYDDSLARLSRRLGLRTRARLWVTSSHCGPAVVGLFRPVIVLPQVVVQGKRPEELEPILAHELIHVRRGDLWLGLLQTAAKALWWFHPLVWLATRQCSREAERCCDEEVLGSLGCGPARYARSLLEILELKRTLQMVPAFPGMKPVDVTSQRLERIMQLRQGCRQRTPWWCWLVLVLSGAATLPGAALLVADEERTAPAPATASTPKTVAGGLRPQDIVREYQVADVIAKIHIQRGEDEPATLRWLVKWLPKTRPVSLAAPLGTDQFPCTSDPVVAIASEEARRIVVTTSEEMHRFLAAQLDGLRQHGVGELGIEIHFITAAPPIPERERDGVEPSPDVHYPRVYNVGDLLGTDGNAATASREQRSQGIAVKTAALDELARRVRSEVLPDTWGESGGPASIETFPTNLCFVVSHTEKGHLAVHDYLNNLRKQQGLPPAPEQSRFRRSSPDDG